MFSRIEELLSVAVILIGFAIRAWLLVTRGENYEVDQAVILYWGREYWRAGTPAVFGPEFTQWEMLASYLFGGLDLLGLNPQWGAFTLSAVEVGLTGLLSRAFWGRGAALAAMALLAVSPWHVFYSSIVGTCVAVGIWPLLLLAFRWPWPLGIALRAVGLWHYSAFRVFLAAEFLWALLRKHWREAVPVVAGFAVFLGATVWIQPDLWRQAFFRGEYVLETPGYAWWTAVPRGLVFLVTPLALFARGISDMEVGAALVEFLGRAGFPLTLVGTLLLGLGIYDGTRRWRALGAAEKFTLFFAGFAILAVSFAASFTHLLFLVPFLALWMARGLLAVGEKRRPFVFALAVLVMAGTSARMPSHFAKAGSRDLFSRRIAAYARVLDGTAPGSPQYAKYLLSSQGLVEGRYWMSKFGSFVVLPPQDPETLRVRIAEATGRGREVWILVDRFVDPELDARAFPEIAEQNRLSEDFIGLLKRQSQVIEERPLEEGAMRAVLLKIRWL